MDSTLTRILNTTWRGEHIILGKLSSIVNVRFWSWKSNHTKVHNNLWWTVFINHNDLWWTVKINHNFKFINVYDSFINYENLNYDTFETIFTAASSLRSSFSICRAHHCETCQFGPCHRVQASMWLRHKRISNQSN